MKLSDFKVLKEDSDSFHIGHPDGKSFKVPKAGLSSDSHLHIKRMYDGSDGEVEDTQPSVQPDPQIEDKPPEQTPQNTDISTNPQDLINKMSAKSEQTNPVESKKTESMMPTKAATDAYKSQQAANTEMAQAKGLEGAKQSQAIAQNNLEISNLPTQQSIIQGYRDKDKQFEGKLEDIDPARLFHNMNNWQKLSAGVGMILGGIGAGKNGRNMAYEYINNAVNQDIDAQKHNQAKTMNLWKMNREALGTDLAANTVTQNQLYTALGYKLKQAEFNAATPIEAARAHQANAVLQQQLELNRQKMSWVIPTQESTGGHGLTEAGYKQHLQGLQAFMPELYKEEAPKLVPGVGYASTPLDPADREDFNTYNQLDQAIDHAIHLAETNGTTYGGIPIPGFGWDVGQSQKNSASEEARNDVLFQLKKLNLSGGKGAGKLDEKFFEAASGDVPPPGAWRTQHAISQFKDLKERAARHKEATIQNLGITRFQKSPEDNVAIQAARQRLSQNPGDPVALKVLQLNGVR